MSLEGVKVVAGLQTYYFFFKKKFTQEMSSREFNIFWSIWLVPKDYSMNLSILKGRDTKRSPRS